MATVVLITLLERKKCTYASRLDSLSPVKRIRCCTCPKPCTVCAKHQCLERKLDQALHVLGFRHSASEHAVYTCGQGASRLLVGVYVDNLVITVNNDSEIKLFKLEMQAQFKLSDLGLLSFYLGIEVIQRNDGICLSQVAYTRKVLDKAGMHGRNPCHMLMEPRFKLSKISSAPPVDTTEYREIVGSLRYLVHIRPDISFVVRYVNRFIETQLLSTWPR